MTRKSRVSVNCVGGRCLDVGPVWLGSCSCQENVMSCRDILQCSSVRVKRMADQSVGINIYVVIFIYHCAINKPSMPDLSGHLYSVKTQELRESGSDCKSEDSM